MPRNISMQSGNYFEFAFGLNSNLDIKIGGKKYKMKDNLLYFLSPNQSVRLDIDEPTEGHGGYILMFTSDFLNFPTSEYNVIQRFPYFNIHLSPVYMISETHSKRMIQLLEQVYKEFQIVCRKNLFDMFKQLSRCCVEISVKNKGFHKIAHKTLQF